MSKNTKLKENPLIKDTKKIKEKGLASSDDGNEVKKFLIIIIILALIIIAIYAVTEIFHKKEEEKPEVVAGEINYNKVSVGTILNRPYDEYYVILFRGEDNRAVEYSTLMTLYTQKDNSLKIYYCDLDNKLNSSYYDVNNDNKSNPKAKKVEEFDFGDITLLRIKKGKIVDYIENYKTIQEKLK